MPLSGRGVSIRGVEARHVTAIEVAGEMEILTRRLEALARVLRVHATDPGPPGQPMRLLTADDVVARTGLSRGRVYELARRGEAGAVRVGARGVRFDERALLRWLQDGGSDE